MPNAPLVARKTITTIQEGSVYKERFTLTFDAPYGTVARMVWKDSAGADIVEIFTMVEGYYVEFREPYDTVASVPNGAGFYCYLQGPGDDPEDWEMTRYGTTFRRQLTFPNSPATATSTVVRQFEDSFQRPAGAVGGRWRVLTGRPKIYDNTEWFGFGADHPNTVGADWDIFHSYYMYYYQAFNDDTVDITISATKKGGGITIITLCGNSSASSYLYAGLNAGTNKVVLGYGTAPDIGALLTSSTALQPQITPVNLTVPGNDGYGTYKISYDDVTKELAFWNADRTVKIAHWTDSTDIVPHGKGYRYFGLGGNSGLLDSGIQLAFIKAQGIV